MSCCQFNLVICNRRLWSILSLTCWLNIPSEHPLWSHDITNLTDSLEEWVMNPPHPEFFNTKIADRFQIIVLQFAFTVSSVQTLVYPSHCHSTLASIHWSISISLRCTGWTSRFLIGALFNCIHCPQTSPSGCHTHTCPSNDSSLLVNQWNRCSSYLFRNDNERHSKLVNELDLIVSMSE